MGILMENGEVITDPTWQGVDDVMRNSHGHGSNRVTGELIEIPEFPAVDIQPFIKVMDKVNEAFVNMAMAAQGVAAGLAKVPEEARCEDYSWLYLSQCAHCLGHVADWESEPKRGE